MTITTNLTQAKAVAEAKRVAKLAEDLKPYGGEHTALADPEKQDERQDLIDTSIAMRDDIQNATDISTLRACIDALNS